ncbi:MAG TPA: arginine deiminase family protein [Bryobacteraceae bacterium]|nr:arginine deiminase family protein [Bryobacteraceae bacterium]
MLIAITREVSASLAQCELTWLDRQAIDIEKARAEHRAYEECLRDLGARVISLPALDEYPDAVFVEDPAIVLDEVAVIATMGAASRRGERESLAEAVGHYRQVIRMRDPARLEGGDVMRVGRQLYAGLSGRTDAGGVAQLGELLAPYRYRVHGVELRGCLHLKSACCALRDDTVLLNREWVDTSLFGGYRLIDVAASEPGAANALAIGNTVVMPDAYPATAEILQREGFTVRALDMTELMKAESGVTCSSLLFDFRC